MTENKVVFGALVSVIVALLSWNISTTNEPDGLIPQIDVPHDPQGEAQILFII